MTDTVKSDTSRTDGCLNKIYGDLWRVEKWETFTLSLPGQIAAFARQLERELAKSEMQNFDHKTAIGVLQSELARYEQAMPEDNRAEFIKHLREEAFDCPLCRQTAAYIERITDANAALKVERDDLKAKLAACEKLLKAANCPACDGSGAIPRQVSDLAWAAEQCQWCYERNAILKENNHEPS